MRIFFSLFIGLALLCLLFTAFGQSNVRTTQAEADDYMGNLDKSYVTSGILYNRAFPAASLNIFSSSEVSSSGHWLESRTELYKSALSTNGLLSTESLQNLIYKSTHEQNIVPIGVSLVRFQEVNSTAVETDPNGKLRLKAGFTPSQTFNTKQAVIASPLAPSVPLGTSNFSLPNWAVLSNQGVGISNVIVNFADGGTAITLIPGNPPVQVYYSNAGIKQLTFTITCTDGSQRTAKSELEVLPNARVMTTYPYFDSVSSVDSTRIEADIPFQGYDEWMPFKGKGDVLTYYASGRSQLRKPIILIDGFDPMDTRSGLSFYEQNMQYISGSGEPQLLGNKFRENTPGNGYDVIILNAPKYEYTSVQELVCRDLFHPIAPLCSVMDVPKYRAGGGDYIERNAMVLVKLIQTVNQQLQANGSNEKITIIGPSMGGLISRYALRYMEQNNMNHNCKLWVSFDSPHHGANIPIGMQAMLVHMGYDMGLEGPRKAVEDLLFVPAARQMLIHHYEGTVNDVPGGSPGYRDRFVQTMTSMGFPQASCMRKVALNNGSKNGTSQNFPLSGGQAMEIKAELTTIGSITCAFTAGFFCIAAKDRAFSMKVFTAPSGDSRGKVMDKSFLNFGWGGAERHINGIGQPSVDILPGGYGDYFQLVVDQAKTKKWMYKTTGSVQFPTPSFIPSVSSFALKDLNRNWGASLNNINVKTDTPFDAIYAPDANERHTIITQAGVDFIRTQLALADQQCIAPTLPLNNGCYTIKAKHSNKFLQPENGNNGARIRQYAANGQDNQIFRLENANSHKYQIISKSSNKAWEVNHQNFGTGAAIQLGDWSGNEYQKWSIREGGDGTYLIDLTTKLGGYQADIEGVSTNDGAGMHLWDILHADNQRFYFTSVSCDNPVSCNYTISASASNGNPSPGQAIQLNYNCSGGDCGGMSYAWSGHGASGSASPYNITAPTASGTHTYTVTATKAGCSKTATTTITVSAGSSSYSQCKEAESSAGNGAITSDPNASNGQTRGTEGNNNHYVDYALTGVPSAGTYVLTIRYYSTSAPTVGIQINGGSTQTVSLANSGSWNIAWTEQTINVNLAAGNNTIRIQGTGGGSCRQDRICVTGGGGGCTAPGAPTLSASPSAINAGASSTLSASGCSGTVTWSHGLGTGTSKPVSPSATTTYTATCTANGCTSSTASVTVTVNGQSGSYSQCKEAESSTGNGAITGDPNASNGQTRGTEGNNNHYVDYALTGVPSAGTYYVKLRYYSSSAPTVGVQVNGGTSQTVNLANSGSWNIAWTEQTISVNLAAGNNTIRIQGTGGGSCRQDRICVTNNANARIGAAETSASEIFPEKEDAEANGLLITPNPNTGTFEVAFYLEKGKKATLSVVDVKGNSWLERQVSGKGSNKEKVVLADNAVGTFIVLLRKDNGAESRKVIVIR
jgi:hypothetical protein